MAQHSRSLNVPSSSGAPEVQTSQEIQIATASMPTGSQPLQHQQYSAPSVQNFVTPAMWRESVASVYEGGLKRGWDYDSAAGSSQRIWASSAKAAAIATTTTIKGNLPGSLYIWSLTNIEYGTTHPSYDDLTSCLWQALSSRPYQFLFATLAQNSYKIPRCLGERPMHDTGMICCMAFY